jgi:hypothetical protein
MTRFFLSAALLTLVGCATPTSGTYTLTSVGDVTTDCTATSDDTGDSTDDTSDVKITVADDKSTVTWGEGDGAMDCPLDGVSFSCEFSSDIDYNQMASMDAVVTITATIDGKWVSSSKISGTAAGGSSCEGSACADIEAQGTEFCSSSQDFEGELKE